jgi:hypothetical protein
MPTRKQKRRDLKSQRHDYEFVYVDGDGKELEEVPEEAAEPKKERTNGSKPGSKATGAGKRSQPQSRGRRQPPEPSWNRALKRGGMLGVVVLVLFSLGAKGSIVKVIPLALLYTLLFVPFTYYIDRFAYRRWQARQSGAAPPTKKR